MKAKVCLCLLLLAGPYLTAQNCISVIVQYEKADKKLNAKVGHEYRYYTKVSGQQLEIRQKVKLQLCQGEQFKVEGFAMDEDPEYDDLGEEIRVLHFDNLSKPGKYSLELPVDVVENAGRYSGERSTFTFHYGIYVTKSK